ncbi:MAG: EpsI family protein [Proteobacteria bacterium]|nr:EpsI family protein [Pseudomonadota bacterium]
MISKGRVFTVIALFAITWYLLQMTSEVTPVPIKKALALFPHQVGGYHLSKSFQSSAGVVELLGVDDYLQYNYIDDTNTGINLYVGYYKAVGVSGGYHSPKNCLPGGGWGIDRVKEVVLRGGAIGEKQATVSQMLIRNGAEYQMVLYWYQNRGRIIASEYWEKVYLVLDAMLMQRRDGTFIRIMAVVPDKQIEATEEKLKKFAEQTMTLLEDHLPGRQL